MKRAFCSTAAAIKMMAIFLALAMAFSAEIASADEAAEDADAAAETIPQTDDIQDILFLVPDGAHLVRLHIRRGDTGYQALWGDYLAGLFERLDRDRSGDLDEVELNTGPWSQLAGAPPTVGGAIGTSQMTMLDFDVETEDERVSFGEFIDFLAPYCSTVQFSGENQNANGPFNGGRVPSPTPWSGIGERLDVNNNQELTLTEVADPLLQLRRLDSNDDEMFGLLELNPDVSPITFARRVNVGGRSDQAPARPAALGVLPEESKLAFIRRLVKTYDTGPTNDGNDGLLGRLEWPSSNAQFDAIDADKNEKLNENELLAWYERLLPEVEASVRCDVDRSKAPTVEAFRSRGVASPDPTPDMQLTETKEGLVIRWTTSEVEIRAQGKGDRPNQQDQQTQFFEQADGDNNGYLDEAESRNYVQADMFKQMDADGNKMVFLEEWSTFYKSLEEIAFGRSEVRIGDNGSSLFELLDTNSDGRLSTRELRNLKNQVEQWDRDGNGLIVAADMPRRYRIDVGGGAANTNQFTGMFFLAGAVNSTTSTPSIAPEWFRAMDRNSDGDVSRREFLNNRAAFDRLDADHDDLISAAEAEAAK